MNNMFFLKKFGEEERLKLLEQGMYQMLEEGQAVYHQGELGDFMYIILKGSVGVRVKDSLFGSEPLFVSTLREGEQFGELTMIGGKLSAPNGNSSAPQRRRASCICMEECHLLAFPAGIVNEIVYDLLNTKLKSEIDFFQNVAYFSVPFLA